MGADAKRRRLVSDAYAGMYERLGAEALPSAQEHLRKLRGSASGDAAGKTQMTLGEEGRVAIESAASPCAMLTRLSPDAASIVATLSFAAPCAAIPTSAHAPHCTLVAVTAAALRLIDIASRHALAAE